MRSARKRAIVIEGKRHTEITGKASLRSNTESLQEASSATDTGRCSRAWRRTRLLRERRMAAELDLDDVAAAELAELRRRLESRGE